MCFSAAAQRRMKCTGDSRCDECVGEEDGADLIGGFATDVSSPQADRARSRGAANAPARMRRTPIEPVPPETAVDVLLTVPTSRRLGEKVVEGDREDVVVVGQVDDVDPRSCLPPCVVEAACPRSVGRVGAAAAGA